MPSECYKCGLKITFKKLSNGKLCPTNVDGSDHWDICSKTRLGPNQIVGELEFVTVPLGKIPDINDHRLPWDDSIVSDWSWCRGYKVVKAVNAYRIKRGQQPSEIIPEEWRSHMASIAAE